ncbi:uncharacterized protein [Solanum lycopersicum]|uniref:uncharacterized protein n=1 Tax=Solanum lycopersicum TaxID=4081 RepID=UPI00374A8D69
MKKYDDQHRCSVEFNVGDKVLMKLTPQIWKQIVSKTRHRFLIPKYDSPFEVVKRVGEVSYRLKLPERLKIYPTFHMSFLKPYFEDADDPDRNTSKRALPSVPTQYDTEIEKILDHRVLGTSKKNTKTEFLVHWKGKSAADAVWEKAKTYGIMSRTWALVLTWMMAKQCNTSSRCLGVGKAA